MANTSLTVTGTNCTVTGGTVAKSTNGASATGASSADFLGAGKFYFEFIPDTIAGTGPRVGICNSAKVLTTAGSANGIDWLKSGGVGVNGTSVATAATWVAGTVNGVAINFGLRKAWFRVGAAGNWNNQVGSDPATGVGGISFVDGGGFLAPFCQLNATNDQITFNFGDSAFSGAVPTGFTSGFPTNVAGTAMLATQSGAEVFVADTPALYVSQVGAEIVVADTSAFYVSQLGAEVWVSVANASPVNLTGRVRTQSQARATLTPGIALKARATAQAKAAGVLVFAATTVNLTGRVATMAKARAALLATTFVNLAGMVVTQAKAFATLINAAFTVDQLGTEVWVEDPSVMVVSQAGAEVHVVDPSAMIVGQVGAEIVAAMPSRFEVSQLGAEVWVTVATATVVNLAGRVSAQAAARSQIHINVNLVARVAAMAKAQGPISGGADAEIRTATILMVDPRYETAMSWTAKNTPALMQYGSIPKLMDEAKWQQWANYVVALPAFAAINAPRPEHFPNWRMWAVRFNECATLLPATST